METQPTVGKPKILRNIIFLVIALIMLTLGVTYYFINRSLNKQVFYNGITIDGIKMDGLSKGKSLELLKSKYETKYKNINIELNYNNKKWDINRQSVVIKNDIDKVVNQAFDIGRQGDIIHRMSEIKKTKKSGRSFTVKEEYDFSSAQKLVDQIVNEISVKPVDATVKFYPHSVNMFAFTASKAGVSVDGKKLFDTIKTEVLSNDNSAINIHSETVQPSVKLEDLRKCTTKIASFTTFLNSNANRNQNIKIASDSFDGRIVMPGEVFSLNSSTGERTKDKGYMDAPVIVSGTLENEPGGGVCQVASTLYNAALMSDLKIVERYHHSWPSSYVPVGRDATVNYPNADIKFKNEKSTPVFISKTISGNNYTIEIYGEPVGDHIQIKVESQVLQTIEPPDPIIKKTDTIPAGTTKEVVQPHTGYKSKTYKVYMKNGVEVDRKLVAQDQYNAVQGQYMVGTGK